MFTPISIHVDELFEDVQKSFLSAAATSGSSTISVASISGFAVNKILLIGDLGGEKSEIIKTHSSTAPSGSTVTLASNLVFSHAISTVVYILDYDQVEISHSATVDGAKSVLATISIQADQDMTTYTDSTQSAGYFFVRYKNSITGVFSDYSDAIPIAGFGENTVGKAISYALTRNNTGFTENITHDFLIEEANNCLSEIRGKLKRWATLQVFDYSLGATVRGKNIVALPANIYQPSNRSILGVRIGTGTYLTYKDKKEWVEYLEGIAQTTLNGGVSAGATSIVLTDASNFDDSGSVLIKGQTITYTGKTSNTLTGIPASGTGSVTATLTDLDEVWQGASEGSPLYYTVIDGNVHFYPLVDSTLVGKPALLDYWTEAPSVDSDGDTLDIYGFRAVKYYLTWVVKSQLKSDGARDENDSDYKKFLVITADAIRAEGNHGQKFKWQPKLNTGGMGGSSPN